MKLDDRRKIADGIVADLHDVRSNGEAVYSMDHQHALLSG
jgi:hypothetical protein